MPSLRPLPSHQNHPAMTDAFSQKTFFLESFAGSTLLLIIPSTCDGDPADLPLFAQVVGELSREGVKGILLFQARNHLLTLLQPILERLHIPCLAASGTFPPREVLLGQRRLGSPWLAVALPDADQESFFQQVVALGAALRAPRAIFLDGEGGVRQNGHGVVSYMNPVRLRSLLQSGATGARTPLLQAILALVLAGTDSISLCRMADLAGELYTYEGKGSYFSQRHYCRVRRLGIDDFPGMEALVRRGEQEGFLLPRGEESLMELLLAGYGAFMADDRLAGVCALLVAPYRPQQAGEIVGLYTLTRFQGEGVASRLLHRVRLDGRRLGLRYLFACTRIPRVEDFFRHHGFHRAAPDQTPPEKWLAYDEGRKQQLSCLRLNLEG